jgi:ketosteroid isomerase-like protein
MNLRPVIVSLWEPTYERPAVSDLPLSEVQHPDDAERRELERFADGWAAAIVANDAALIGEFMVDDWVMVSETGITTRDHFLGVVKSGRLTHSAMRRVSPLRVRRFGDLAVLTARITNTAHFGGQQFDADEWTTDLLVRADDRWVCVQTQITSAREVDPADS